MGSAGQLLFLCLFALTGITVSEEIGYKIVGAEIYSLERADVCGWSDSMEHSRSWKPGQEIALVLYKTKVHYRFHKNSPVTSPWPEPERSSSHPIYLRSIFSIILPSTRSSSMWSLSPQVSPLKLWMHLWCVSDWSSKNALRGRHSLSCNFHPQRCWFLCNKTN